MLSYRRVQEEREGRWEGGIAGKASRGRLLKDFYTRPLAELSSKAASLNTCIARMTVRASCGEREALAQLWPK